MRELQEVYGLYEGVLLPGNPEYPNIPLVFKKSDGAMTILLNKSPEYDFRMFLPKCTLYGKIFVSPRNFRSRNAIGMRYKNYLENTAYIMRSHIKEPDLWVLFVKTPEKWRYLILPLSNEQWIIIKECFKEIRKKSSKFKIKARIHADWGEDVNYSDFTKFLIFYIQRC